MLLKFDLHVHTLSRGKVYVDAPALKKAITSRGLDGVAVTNFFDIEHALWLKTKLPEHHIIIGQEIWTNDGHLIGLGLSRRVKDSQGAVETVKDIHEQGGLAVAVHPFVHHGLGQKALEARVDAIEVYNGLMGALGVFNARAALFARKHGIPELASSDTSCALYVGFNQTHVDASGRENVLDALKAGKTRLVRRALPLPWMFAFKNLSGFKHVKPWPIHATPCLVCGESWVLRFKSSKRTCLGCGLVEPSHIGCCQGHYYCISCLIEAGHKRALELRQCDYVYV